MGNTNALVSVTAPNVAPTAGFTHGCTDLDCNFTDTSTDSDGTVVAWLWDFGDGNGSSAQNPSHSYAAAGDYTVSLTVTDDDGAADNTNTLVSVSAPPAAEFRLHTGVVNNVDSSGWTTVVLPESFTSMVVVATPNYSATDLPVVTRIHNVTSNSFDVRLANPSGNAVPWKRSGTTVPSPLTRTAGPGIRAVIPTATPARSCWVRS
jgi:PKD repeat protein